MLFWVSLNIMQVPGCQHGRLCCKEEELSTQSTWVKHRSYRTALGLSCPRGASVHPSDSNAHRDGICCSSAPEQSQGQLTLLKRCTCGPEVSRFLCCAQLNQFGTKRGESPLGAELPAVSIKLKKVKSLKKKNKICEHKVKKKQKVKINLCFTFGGARDQGQGFLFSSQFCYMLSSERSLPCAQVYRSAQQSFNFCLELRCKSSTLYASGTNNSHNKLDCCWVRPPSTALMTSPGLPEAPLFDDCAKGRLV